MEHSGQYFACSSANSCWPAMASSRVSYCRMAHPPTTSLASAYGPVDAGGLALADHEVDRVLGAVQAAAVEEDALGGLLTDVGVHRIEQRLRRRADALFHPHESHETRHLDQSFRLMGELLSRTYVEQRTRSSTSTSMHFSRCGGTGSSAPGRAWCPRRSAGPDVLLSPTLPAGVIDPASLAPTGVRRGRRHGRRNVLARCSCIPTGPGGRFLWRAARPCMAETHLARRFDSDSKAISLFRGGSLEQRPAADARTRPARRARRPPRGPGRHHAATRPRDHRLGRRRRADRAGLVVLLRGDGLVRLDLAADPAVRRWSSPRSWWCRPDRAP